jgi:hypothetical protein
MERDNCELCHGASGGVRGNENIVGGKVICDYCHARQSSGKWLVLRHGGRNADTWRIAFRGPEDEANLKYATIATALRQGAVELVSTTECTERISTPRLRTRW